MLRARGWKDRGSTYVCAFCRHQLFPRTEIRQSQDALARLAPRTALASTRDCGTSICGTRQLSTTTALRNSNQGGNGPGAFPRSFSRAGAGAFGSFGSGSAQPSPTGQPAANDGLLPHERAARQKAASVQQAPAPPTRAAAQRPARAAGGQNTSSNRLKERSKGPARPKNETEAKLSSSVLADIFNKSRTPRSSSTPTQASRSNNRVAQEIATQGQSSRANKAPESRNRSAASKATQASPATKQNAASKPKGWGTFSNRETTTPDVTTESTTRFSQAFDRARSDKDSPQVDEVEPKKEVDMESFWDELESRAESPRQPGQNGRKRGSRFTANSTSDAIDEQTSISGRLEDTVGRDRRSSRFDAEEPRVRGGKKAKNRGKNNRDSRYDEDTWDEETLERWERAQQRKADKEAQRALDALAKQDAPTAIFLPEYINISNLAQALKQPQANFLRDLEEMGFENVTHDTIMTGETAALIAAEYNFEPTVDTGSQRDLRPRPPPEDVTVLPPRPPVVTIMGHVDHGKTTLLDWLRKSSVAAQEHGGITQHIGAFVVSMSTGKSITFLDTPGHAAFLSMRQRGANVTDIVVLVVAADDSVMPQTLEALKHARSSKVPIIVAINKIDKEDARVNEVKADLSRHGVEIEDYGGDVQVVCVSGKTGQGMQDLEENIITLSEVLDVRAETDGMAEGWVLESSIKQDGKTATVLVKRGTLRPGDYIVAGKTWARIRVLRNEAGMEIDEAPPGTPVEILGWRELPTAGELILQSPDEAKAKTAVEYREEMAEREETSQQIAEQEQRQREKAAAEAAAKQAEEEGLEAATEDAAPTTIFQNFTVKADVVGSVEAICGSIQEMGNHEVRPKILRSSAGQISEYDIDHAAASNSIIVNFNCPIQPHIKQLAEAAKVKILDHTVIYHVVDDVKSALSDLLPMSVTSRVVGEASILQVFSINIKKKVFKNIAGCRVRNGTIRRTSLVKVLRRGKVIFEGKVDTLKHLKKDITETGKGSECGIGLDGFQDFEVDDEIQAVEEVKEKRTL